MGDGQRTIWIVTNDETLVASARAAASSLESWQFSQCESADALMGEPPSAGDIILLDSLMVGENVYEVCRRMTGQTRCRTFVLSAADSRISSPIARFCGATGALMVPVDSAEFRKALEDNTNIAAALPAEGRGASAELLLPERLLQELCGETNPTLIGLMTDPETSLFSYEFLTYKLDEEFKRAQRFDTPLSCVMLGFEGQADGEVLQKLAGIFLLASRDTDILGRFDESSFLFLLPNTGPDGAAVMARRIQEQANEQGLSDLVGDLLQLAVGIATFPDPAVSRREDLYARCREAFLAAQRDGGGVVLSA